MTRPGPPAPTRRCPRLPAAGTAPSRRGVPAGTAQPSAGPTRRTPARTNVAPVVATVTLVLATSLGAWHRSWLAGRVALPSGTDQRLADVLVVVGEGGLLLLVSVCLVTAWRTRRRGASALHDATAGLLLGASVVALADRGARALGVRRERTDL